MKIINKSLLIALIALLSATNIHAMDNGQNNNNKKRKRDNSQTTTTKKKQKTSAEKQSSSFFENMPEEMILEIIEACLEPNNIKESGQTLSQIAQTCKKMKRIISKFLPTTREIKNATNRDQPCFIQLDMDNLAHLFAATGKSKSLYLLLKNFPKLVDSYTAKNSNTPLHVAAAFGHANCVTTLLKHHAKINAFNGLGQTPLECAKEKEIINTIKEYGGFKSPGIKDIDEQLRGAAICGNAETIEKLLKAGTININAQDNYGNTALIIATRLGHTKIVSFLIEVEANVNAQSNNGNTPLIWAERFGYSKIVEQLLQANANVNSQNNQGNTALICCDKVKIVSLLLQAKANAKAQDNDGNTALIWAKLTGHTDIVKMLLKAGANINAQDKENGGKNKKQSYCSIM